MGPEFVQLFNGKVIMAQQVLNFMKDMRDKVMTSITTNSTIDTAQSLLSIINDVEEKTSMKVDKEIQFNEWLFAKLDCLLSPQGFTVCRNKLNKDIMPNVSEYSQCQPDCVIYHNKSVQKTKISAVTVQTDTSESDSDSDVNIEDLDDLVLPR